MKQLAVALSLVGILMAFSWAQPDSGQMEQTPGAPKSMDQKQLQREIMLLRLINEMGLSQDQLTTLKEIVSSLEAGQQAVLQAQQELRDFLASYSGTPEGFAEAVKPYDEKVAQASKNFQEKLQASVERVKSVLTLKQGEILHKFLLQHRRHALQKFAMPMPKWPEDMEFHRRGYAPPKDAWEKLKQLKEQIGRWLDRWGIDLDAKRLERQHAMPRGEEMPMHGGISSLEGDFIERFLMHHLDLLDLLEKIITEKLQKMGTTHI